MERPLVSTISPSFRTKKYLRGFLEGLPRQTYFERMEVVLDHNEPDEEEILLVKEFQERYPGRLKHMIVDPVVPIGTSMNNCIQAANGEIVTIWNIDDLRTPDSIERQVRPFVEDAEVDFVYGDFIEVTEFGRTEGERVRCDYFPPGEFTRSFLLGPFMMFRKSLCERAGLFDEQLVSGCDFDLAVRLAFHGKPGKTSGVLGYHLNEGLGASSRPGNFQALERTVIELRYGIFDKIDYTFVPRAVRYRISEILQRGTWKDVSEFVPDYELLIEERTHAWLEQGVERQAARFLMEKVPPLARTIRYLRSRASKAFRSET